MEELEDPLEEVDQRLEDVREDGRHGVGIVAGLYTPRRPCPPASCACSAWWRRCSTRKGSPPSSALASPAALEGPPVRARGRRRRLVGRHARDPRRSRRRATRASACCTSRGPFGHQMAITAGLDHARGDAVVMIDGDLQDPPELIPELVERWRDGADIVVAKRRAREGETRFKLATARWFYALMGRLAQVDLEPNAGDFRLFDRAPLDALLRMRERSRFLRGMSSWVGFRARRRRVRPRRPQRRARRSTRSGGCCASRSTGMTSFSNFPLQLAALAGFACALARAARPAADDRRPLLGHLRARRAVAAVRRAADRRHPAARARA